jgi:hypothetical protein
MYALEAVNLLKENPLLADDEDVLWRAVPGTSGKVHNSQMDVVTSLWRSGLIKR